MSEIVGREQELASLHAFIGEAEGASLALVLDGEAGIGKTTLFEATIAEAREKGFVVLSCRPASAETAFSFAALTDLLGPLLTEGLERLPVPQRRPLAAALLLEEADGLVPDERAIAFAVLRLLSDQDEPLLVAIDDVQWLDAASASVLAFAFRRFATGRAAILVARRSSFEEVAPLGLDRAFPDERLRRMWVGALSFGATHRLLRERLGVSLLRPTLVRLHDTSGGNPFYALELGRALKQSGGRTVAGEQLSIPTSLNDLLSARLAALSADVREVLEPVALLSEPTVSIVEAVVSDGATVRGRLRAAEAATIVESTEERVRFSHPLLAARVEAELDPRRRRSLHRRLAELVGDPEQRARHLALGAGAASARVADELVAASVIAASRGAPGAAAELAELSVSLMPTAAGGRVRRRRQLLAASHHFASGDVERQRAILEELLEQLQPGVERAEVLLQLAGRVDHDLERSEQLLEQAFVEAKAAPRLRAEIVMPRVLTAYHLHGGAAGVRLARDSAQVVEDSGDLVLLTLFLAQLSYVELHAEGLTPGVLERALELEQIVGPLPTSSITPTLVEGLRLMCADEHKSAREALQRAHTIAATRGHVPEQIIALAWLTLLECRAGEWSLADEHAAELAEEGEQRGNELWVPALVDAYLGRLDRARARATEGVLRAREDGFTSLAERHLAVLGLIDVSTGDFHSAAAKLAPVVHGRQSRGGLEPSLYPARELSIEALVAVGDLDAAGIQLGWLEQAGRRLGTPWPLAMGARCRGLLHAAEGDLEAALASCEQALEVHERMPAPFERARTLLIYGTILRRIKRRTDAREAIEAALSIFDGLPAPVWADNARAELARVGGRPSTGDELTEGERRIAELVAAGKSNKETAATLFLSVHTVEGALKRVYRKLEVHSRTELSHRLRAGS